MKFTILSSLILLNCSFSALKSETSLDNRTEDPLSSKKEEDNEEEEKPLKIGNFSIDVSQQPSPLISFGQNVINQGQTQLFLFIDDSVGRNKHSADLILSAVRGVTDNFSIYFSAPYAIDYKDGSNHSSGLEDFSVQLEYAFYNKIETLYANQATAVFNMSFPTGSFTKNPYTGFGTPSLFFGATYNHTEIYWLWYTSYGAVLPFSEQGNQAGNIYLYQFGFGRYIPSPVGWIFAWQVETDGYYFEKNKNCGIINQNSGGNVIYVTPSLWASSKHLRFHAGTGYAVQQHLNGNQRRNMWLLAFTITYTI